MSQVTPEKAEGLDSQTFITALVSNIAVLSVEVIAFVVLKQRLSRIYEPRSYLPPPDKRAVDLPPGPWKWLLATIAIPTGDVLHKNGMDAYMFLRFLRLLIILFASITLLTWLVLLPVDTAGIKDANFSDRLARLSWGNIPDNARGRYAAHIAVVYVSTFWTLFLIRKELIHYTATRQAFLTSRSHASLAQARTVLITSVPEELCDEKELIKWAAFVPGGVQQVWIYRDTTALNQDYKERLAACEKLEGAVSKLIRHIVKAKRKHDSAEEHAKLKKEHADAKARRRGGKKEEGGGGMEYEMQGRVRMDGKGNGNGNGNAVGRPSTDETVVGDDDGYGERKGSISYEETVHSPTTSTFRPNHSRTKTTELEAGNFSPNSPSSSFQPPLSPTAEERSPGHAGGKEVELMMSPEGFMELYAPLKKRPRHRLGTFGLWGKKVDTIDWCKDEIVRLNKSIREKRDDLTLGDKKPKPMGSAFIQCNLQMGAHVLAQCVSYHEPLMMADKWIDVSPKDVIWDNIDDGAYETRFRYVTSWMGSIVLIFLWFGPVAFVGTLSSVTTLCEKVSWLCWIRDAPTPVPGIIQGILPPLFLAILFAILPWLLKGLAWYENIPRWSLLSISVYKRYFLFLVIHGFLVITLSSGLASTATELVENPTQAVSTLASHLPDASIFFLTWTLTQGLSGAGSALLQIGHLFIHFTKKWLLGRTPREAYTVTFLMPSADFGLVLPRMSLLATIGLAYSVLSPIMNGLAMLSFILLFFSWKFLLTWVFDQKDESETGGQYFPLAINFLFVGMYIEQFCLAVLFFLKISDGIEFIAEGVLMIVLMGLTLSMQLLLQRSFDPITRHLPMSLAEKQVQDRWERSKKISHSSEGQAAPAEDLDLFSRERIKSVIHHKIAAPVQKVVREVQKNVAKTANIDPNPTTIDLNMDDPVKVSVDRPRASTSAHSVRNADVNEQQRPISHRSKSSIQAHRTSSSSGHSERSQARSRFPTFDPPAKRQTDGEDEEDEDKDFDVHGFDHPSTYEEQPWIWVPKDPLGISSYFVKDLRAVGVEASDEGATMDPGGTVEVQRNPPDEDWQGGHDA